MLYRNYRVPKTTSNEYGRPRKKVNRPCEIIRILGFIHSRDGNVEPGHWNRASVLDESGFCPVLQFHFKPTDRNGAELFRRYGVFNGHDRNATVRRRLCVREQVDKSDSRFREQLLLDRDSRRRYCMELSLHGLHSRITIPSRGGAS